MDDRLKDLIKITQQKFGLDHYFLKRHSLSRYVNIFNETMYTLSMEWFPNQEPEPEDDSNPEGTAVIELDIHKQTYISAVFVMGKTYAENGISFEGYQTDYIIKWIEQETGLMYGQQFQLDIEEKGRLFFKEVYHGIAVSPSGSIEIKFDEEGKLTLFAVHGHFPSREMIKEDTFTLTFKAVEHLAKKQLKLIDFPSYEQKKLHPMYAIEEIYVSNEEMDTIPFEFIADRGSYLQIDQTIDWEEPIRQSFERKEIAWTEEVTVEQAFLYERSPDSYPISKTKQEKCVLAVKDFLRQEYPNDSGKWILKTLHRDNGYIHATLKEKDQDQLVFQRKLLVMLDADSLQAANYMDNKPFLEMLDEFEAPDKILVNKDEAYEKLKEWYELKPYYVYDFKQKHYVLCGKLDCHYGLHASNGKIMKLNEL